MFGVTSSLPPVYIPAELAVLRFSLTAGVEEVAGAFLQPGPVPRGYTRECRDNSRRLHQIPLDGRDTPPLRQMALSGGPATFRRSGDLEVCGSLEEVLGAGAEVFCLPGREEQDRAVVELLYTRYSSWVSTA